MKKTILAASLILLLLLGLIGYRIYKERLEDENASRLTTVDDSATKRQQADLAAAEAEAARLATEKARKDAEAAAAELERRRAEQAAAEAARLRAETDLAAANASRAIAAKEAEALEADARRAAEQRAKDAAAADASRREALAKLARADREKEEATDREAARLAALKAQEEREAELATKPVPLVLRSIMPSDYKRRQHYYLQVDLWNAASTSGSKSETPPPVPLK